MNWNRSTPNRPVTDDEVVASVERLGAEGGSSFGPGFGRGWVEPGEVAFDLNTGYGRVNGACLQLVALGRLVQGPQRSAFFKLSERERAARRRAREAAVREQVEREAREEVARRTTLHSDRHRRARPMP